MVNIERRDFFHAKPKTKKEKQHGDISFGMVLMGRCEFELGIGQNFGFSFTGHILALKTSNIKNIGILGHGFFMITLRGA